MMIINEWLPNPSGDDSQGEWIELLNSGREPTDLSGWRLENSRGKDFIFSHRTLAPHEFLFLPRSESKLTLRNQDESLLLYDARGALADKSSFKGTAPEGKSMSRNGANFLFTTPSPGAQNRIEERALLADIFVPTDAPLRHELSGLNVLGISFGVGIFFATLFVVMIMRNENFYHLLFGGDEEIR